MIREYPAGEDIKLEYPAAGVLQVTLNRPKSLNAMTADMHSSLIEIFEDAADDGDTNAILLAGAGRAFCAGSDMKSKQPRPAGDRRSGSLNRQRKLVKTMVECDKPIVSAVRGAAVGSGLALALMADIVIVSKDARLMDGNVKLGVASGDHACLTWPLQCGMAKAKYYLLTGSELLGSEAERIGLASLAVDDGEVLSRAVATASLLAAGSQTAIQHTKRALNGWLQQSMPIYDHAIALAMLDIDGDDAREARAAFADKGDR